jgi:hypothetical protein
MVDWELVKQPHVAYAQLVLEFGLEDSTAAMIAVLLLVQIQPIPKKGINIVVHH